MCEAFIAALDKRPWTAYPETAGFDILLVRKKDGFQIGVEAKLRLNTEVVIQSLPRWQWDRVMTGPDCRAVLVPEYATDNGMGFIAGLLGITVIRVRDITLGQYTARGFSPSLPDENYGAEDWHEWCPVTRCALPEYVPDVKAGSKSPLQLTQWKIRAIKLAIILEERPVTRADFKQLSLDPSRWTDKFTGWLNATPQGYVRADHCPDFKAQHPVVYEQIKADKPKWIAENLL